MTRTKRIFGVTAVLLLWATSAFAAEDIKKLDSEANAALQKLFSEAKGSKEVVSKAAGILIFPDVTKAGLGVGGESGKGVLRGKRQNRWRIFHQSCVDRTASRDPEQERSHGLHD